MCEWKLSAASSDTAMAFAVPICVCRISLHKPFLPRPSTLTPVLTKTIIARGYQLLDLLEIRIGKVGQVPKCTDKWTAIDMSFPLCIECMVGAGASEIGILVKCGDGGFADGPIIFEQGAAK